MYNSGLSIGHTYNESDLREHILYSNRKDNLIKWALEHKLISAAALHGVDTCQILGDIV